MTLSSSVPFSPADGQVVAACVLEDAQPPACALAGVPEVVQFLACALACALAGVLV